MFKEPTTFILGAGASWHYGYPTGEGLVSDVVSKAQSLRNNFVNMKELYQRENFGFLNHIPKFFVEKHQSLTNQSAPTGVESYFNNNLIKPLDAFIQRIEDANPPVIDHFLFSNEDIRDIGELMIAWVILERESEYAHKGYNVNRIALNQTSKQDYRDNWYRFILYKLLIGCKQASDLHKNKVNFVTFNYDISLETYLYRTLRSTHLLKENEGNIAKDFLTDRFVHVYGQVHANPFQDIQMVDQQPVQINQEDASARYKKNLDIAYESSKGIRTIESHNKDDQAAQKKAHAMIDAAKRVYILGYGFDETNSGRLKLSEMLSESEIKKKRETVPKLKKEVYFTNFRDMNSVNKKAAMLLTGNIVKFLPNEPAIYKGKQIIPEYLDKDGKGDHVFFEKSIKNVYDALAEDFEFL